MAARRPTGDKSPVRLVQQGPAPPDDDPPAPPKPPGGPPQREDDARPTIKIGPDIDRVLTEAVDSLRLDDSLYQRSAELVRVGRVAASDAESEREIGTPVIHSVDLATLRVRLARTATWMKWHQAGEEWRQVRPDKDVTPAVLTAKSWPGVRTIVGVTETPIMRPDGSLVQDPGHDRATGYLYLPPPTGYPRIADAPTLEDARASLAVLLEVWSEFPWASPAAGAIPVAALCTLLVRAAIVGNVPAFLFDATVKGSGKSVASDSIMVIATGREGAKMSWPLDEDEREKIMAAFALRGAAAITLDNVRTTLGGAALDRVLTCGGLVALRILGKTECPDLPWRAVIIAGGNNVAIGDDTCRRVLVARMESQEEKPWEKTDWKRPHLVEWCKAERAFLVAHALTLLRAYVVAGRPPQAVRPLNSFDAWRELVASAIVWAGGPDVIATLPTSSGEDDSETSALRVVLSHWPMITAEFPDGLSAKQAIEILYTRERMRGDCPPDGYNDLREAIESVVTTKAGSPPDARRFGYKLRDWKGRIIGGVRLRSNTAHGGITRWRVEKA